MIRINLIIKNLIIKILMESFYNKYLFTIFICIYRNKMFCITEIKMFCDSNLEMSRVHIYHISID